MLTVTLVLSKNSLKNLKSNLGEDRVTVVGEPDSDGYSAVSFELRNNFDVLSVLHAGQDTGVGLVVNGATAEPVEA